MKTNLKELNLIPNLKIDLDRTLLGGQAFNWDKIDGIYYGFFEDKIMKIVEEAGELYWQTYPNKNDLEFASNYLDLNRDYAFILKEINKDPQIDKAIQSHSNVRVLNQDFNQTVLSFILTSHKNIKAVRKSIRDIVRMNNSSIEVDGKKHYFFPRIEFFSNLSEHDFRKLGAGFRSNYLVEASAKLNSGELNKAIFSTLNSEKAREILIQNKGIGEKIADCILGFALGYTDITPIDVWGKRVLTELYDLPDKSSYKTLSSWYSNYFKENTLFAGQILFEYLRENYRL